MKFIATKIAREKRTVSTVHLPLSLLSESRNGLHKEGGFRFLNRLWSGIFGRFSPVGCFAPAKEFSNPNRKHLKSIRCGFLAALALPLTAGIALGASTLSISGIKRTNSNVIVSWTGNVPGPYQLLCRTNIHDDWTRLGATTSAMSATVPANQRACFFSVTTDTIAPSTPGTLTIATNTDPSKLTLTWSPSSDNNGGTGLKDYLVYRNNTVLVGKVSATRTTLVDTNLTVDTTYTYSVLASDMVGNQSARITGSGKTPKSQCIYSISPTGLSIGAAATSGSVSVSAGVGCAWTATSGASWITITTGTSGNGSGYVYWSVAANTSTSVRSGTLTIAGQSYTLTQAGAPVCAFSISPASASPGAVASSGVVGVTMTSGSGCSWSVSSSASWLTYSPASGSGSASVYWYTTANTATTARSATLTIAGQTFYVTQAGASTCAFSVSPASASSGAVASSGTVGVTLTAGSGCNWSVSSSASWLTYSPASGTGSANVYWYTTANTATTTRSATLNIAGQTINVTQAGAAACSYSISPASASVGAASVNGTVTVTTTAGCVWTASSSASWISITSGTTGNGSGTVYYTVAANTSTASRSGTMTVAGQTFTVSQAGAAASCSYSISPSTASPGSAGGSGTVTVTAVSGCSWTVNSSASWLTYSPSSGAGNGSVTWSATANTSTSSRTATLTIGGQTFTVTQTGVASGGTAGQLQWVRDLPGQNTACTVTPKAVATDRADNIVACGYFSMSADFGTGVKSSVGQQDAFIAKYSPAGSVIWAKTFGEPLSDAVYGVAVDSQNNIIVCGYFNQTVDFGAGPVVSGGYSDIFVAKYSPAGALTWVKRFGGTFNDTGCAVAVDASDNIVVAGYFQGSVDFGGQTLSSVSSTMDVVLFKLSAAGTMTWVKRLGGSSSGDLPKAVAIDGSGDVLVTGQVGGPADFGAGTTAIGGMFVAKYSGVDGSYRWAKVFGGTAGGVAVDPLTGNVVICGQFQGTLTLGGSTLVSADASGFMAGYDAAGNSLWAQGFVGDPGCSSSVNAISIDRNGTIALTGSTLGGAYFGSTYVVGGGLYVAEFSSAGNLLPTYRWCKAATGAGGSNGEAVAFDGSGHILATGSFSQTMTVSGTSVSTPFGAKDGCLVQFAK